MTKYGYARVSTDDQNNEVQVKCLLDAGVLFENIYQDKITGMTFDRDNYKKLFSLLKEGDTLYVTKLDRLGRKLIETLQEVEKITKINVALYCIVDGFSNQNQSGETLIKLHAMVADLERASILERTKMGRQLAIARGVKMGAKPKITNEKLETIYQYHNQGLHPKEIAEIVNCSRVRVIQLLKNKNLKPNSLFYKTS